MDITLLVVRNNLKRKYSITNKILSFLIASVWLMNGLYCKILNQVPRHETIVASIFNNEYSRQIIILIGFLEVCLSIWLFTKYKQKLATILQIFLVLVMNIIEFIIAKELLLWREYNIVFALIFITTVYLNGFYFNKKHHVSQT